MTKREELAAWLAEMSDAAIDELYANAARLRVTMAPVSDVLADDRRAWERAGLQDMTDRLEAIEADLPPGQVDAWLDELWENATPFRYDAATGELIEVNG
jgi:hypothetical protein